MTSLKTRRRRRGRRVRNAWRYSRGQVVVAIQPDIEAFASALAAMVAATAMAVGEAMRVLGKIAGLTAADLDRLGRRSPARRPLIHNGRKHP